MERSSGHSSYDALQEGWIREALSAGVEAAGFAQEAGLLRGENGAPPTSEACARAYDTLAGEALKGAAAEPVRLLLGVLLWTPQRWPGADLTGLGKGLRSKDCLMRVAAAAALGHLPAGSPKVVDVLAAALKDENAAVCEQVVEGLANIGTEAAVGPLCALLADQERSFTESLLPGRPRRPVHLSQSVSTSVRAQMRSQAAWALGALAARLQADDVIPPLLISLLEKSPEVRQGCLAGLQVVLEHSRPEPRMFSLLLDGARRLLSDDSPEVRRAAVKVLGATGSRGVLPDLRARLRFLAGEPDAGIKQEIRRAVERIEAATEHLAAVPLASSGPSGLVDNLPRVSESPGEVSWDKPLPSEAPPDADL